MNQLQQLIEQQIKEQLQPHFTPQQRHPQFHPILRASLLIEAVKEGRLDQVIRALRLGINPNQRSREGETAIEVAITNSYKGGKGLEILRYLIRDGADVNAMTSQGKHLSIQLSEMARWMLQPC